jgi:uncharacterized protein (TIGR02001 family)
VSIKTHLLALGVAAVMTSPALAAEDLLPPPASGSSDSAFTLGGSLAGTSEYFFRGISQTDDKPAVQGGVTAAYKFTDALSANAGVWASNVDFSDARVEVDYTAGLTGSVMGVTWTAGGIYYTYPGSENANNSANEEFDFWELTGGLGYDFGLFSVGGSVNWTPSFQAGTAQTQDSGTGWYLNANVKVPLKYVDLVGAVGRQYVEHNTRWGTPDWTDYKLAVQAMVYGFGLEAAFIDTSLDDKLYTAAADKQFVFTVSKNF